MEVPAALLQSLQHTRGFEEEGFKKVHRSGEQITSVRLNAAKLSALSCSFSIGRHFAHTASEAVPWSSSGYYLLERPSFTSDPLFHGGAYYVQEASSMFLEEIIKQSADLSRHLVVLDLCAAPGGKSTLLQSILSDESLLVSNELIKTRVTVLAENITKWGAPNVIVTNNDPKDFQRLPGYFDIIVVDAPCSGSGLFRKDPKAVNEWSEQNVELCSQRQHRILADILPALKEGGLLIYSTCSYSKKEDEDIVDWLIKDGLLVTAKCRLQSEWNIVETMSAETNAYGYRFYPDQLKGEGFFIAAFRKPGPHENNEPQRKTKARYEKLSSKEVEVVKPWIKDAGEFFFIKQHEDTIALPLYLEGKLADIQAALYIKKAGVKVGAIIRDELIPDHELALSTIINAAIPAIEVDKETALQYLRKLEIKSVQHVKGWALLTYGKVAIGWVKILPNRINNYYPKSWRILNK